MPASRDAKRSNRNSCDFCRGRKLRCDRPLPCTNCVSRGKHCHFGPTITTPSNRQNARGLSTTTAAAVHSAGQSEQPTAASPGTPAAAPVQPATPDQTDLVTEVRALAKLAKDLEKRIVNSTAQADGGQDESGNLPLPTPASTITNPNSPFRISSTLERVSDVVAHLDRVSTSWNNSHEGDYADDLVFKIDRIQNISMTPGYTLQSGKAIRCIWWPTRDESKVLLDKYLTKISHIQHIMHSPSLRQNFVDYVYPQIRGHEPVKPGCLVLLLSIIATATHLWGDVDVSEGCLSLSPAQANAQTRQWIKATYDVLYAGLSSPTLETIQGIIILSFLICNLEGVSLRYRMLISTALLLGRELRLHCIDDESNVGSANPLQAEMGRRAWWYLVATDWYVLLMKYVHEAALSNKPNLSRLMAARHGGMYQTNPRHMMVNKPNNINDVDLHDNGLHRHLPMSQLTDMSYFLQRIRLAEISRTIVDHDPMAVTNADWQSGSGYITAMDMELDQMLCDIPPFLHLDSYEHGPDSTTGAIFIQAYMLNSLLHTARCKLHLKYLTSAPKTSPAHLSSRVACMKAARQIVRAEIQLKYSRNPFLLIRFRLSAILYGVFLASIVLLMDTCINGTGSAQNEIRHGEVAEVLLIIEDARSHSLAATNLYDSLTQILNKHLSQRQQQRQQIPSESDVSQLAAMYAAPAPPAAIPTMPPVQQRPDGLIGSVLDQPRQPLSNGNLLTQSLEELVDFDGFQWDDLFLDLDSSGFF